MRRISAVLGLVGILALSGCVFVRPTQTQPDTVPTSGSFQKCDGVGFTVTGPGYFTLEGDCGVVRVAGDGITIKADSAEAVLVAGSSVSIEMKDAGSLEITGNDVEVDAGAVGATVIRGDRNIVDADTVASLDLQGNDNQVAAEVTGAVTQSGDRNLVGTR